MMKHKVLVLMTAAVTGMLVLTACTSSENVSTQSPSSQNTSNTQSGSQSVSGIQVSQSDAVESFDLPEGINGTGPAQLHVPLIRQLPGQYPGERQVLPVQEPGMALQPKAAR